MIMQADARHIPLADKSVQCVVTSPPYWGLRDYGTATWQGGDEDCDHVQGRPGSGRADGIVDERFQRNRNGAGAMGGDCRKCGATRIDKQIGLEATPEEYVEHMVAVFREVRRVLRDDGTCWVNLGDSYAGSGKGPEGNLNKGESFKTFGTYHETILR
jgi:DNA methylase.